MAATVDLNMGARTGACATGVNGKMARAPRRRPEADSTESDDGAGKDASAGLVASWTPGHEQSIRAGVEAQLIWL